MFIDGRGERCIFLGEADRAMRDKYNEDLLLLCKLQFELKEAEKEIEYEDAHDLVYHRLVHEEKPVGRVTQERLYRSERDRDFYFDSWGDSSFSSYSSGNSFIADIRDPLFSWQAYWREKRAKKLRKLR